MLAVFRHQHGQSKSNPQILMAFIWCIIFWFACRHCILEACLPSAKHWIMTPSQSEFNLHSLLECYNHWLTKLCFDAEVQEKTSSPRTSLDQRYISNENHVTCNTNTDGQNPTPVGTNWCKQAFMWRQILSVIPNPSASSKSLGLMTNSRNKSWENTFAKDGLVTVCRAPVFEVKAELLAKVMSVLLVEVLVTLKNL